MKPASLRRAGPPDLGQLTALLDRYHREWNVHHHDPPALLRSQLAWPALGFYVAECSGKLVACALCRACPSIPGAAECKRLFVAPEARAQGIATRLMRRLEEESVAAGYGWMYLDTKDEFQVAIAFYTRHGYLPVPRYNDNAQATLFFRKRLHNRGTPPL